MFFDVVVHIKVFEVSIKFIMSLLFQISSNIKTIESKIFGEFLYFEADLDYESRDDGLVFE